MLGLLTCCFNANKFCVHKEKFFLEALGRRKRTRKAEEKLPPQLFYLTDEWENLNDSFHRNCFLAFFPSHTASSSSHQKAEANKKSI
jgi:hypothetical protein